jgi:hypothetical protein
MALDLMMGIACPINIEFWNIQGFSERIQRSLPGATS